MITIDKPKVNVAWSAPTGGAAAPSTLRRPTPSAAPAAAGPAVRWDAPALPRPRAAAADVQDDEEGRSWGDVGKDTVVGVGQGAVNLVGGVASLVEQTNPINMMRRAAAEGGYGSGPSTVAADATGRASDYLTTKLSPEMQADKQDLAQTAGFFGSAKKVLTNPALAGQFVAEQVPNLVTLGAGAAVTGARAVAAGALAKPVATKFLTRAATTMEAGSANVQAIQDAKSQPEEVWAANPEYRALIVRGLTPDAAKQTLASRAGGTAALIAAPLAYAGAKIAAPFEADVFTRGITPGGVRGLLSPAGARATVAGAAREAGEEAIQEGGNQFGVNVGMQSVDPTRPLMEGVREAAGIGASIGGVVGGTLNVGGTLASRPQPTQRPGADPAPIDAAPAPAAAAPDVPFPDAVPGGLADAGNLVPRPGRPQPSMAVRPQEPTPAQGTLLDTAATQPQPDIATPLAPAPAAAVPAPTEQVMSPPPAPPWVNTETGEFTEPSDDQVKEQLRQRVELQSQSGQGLRMNTPMLVEAWGLKAGRIKKLYHQVLQERKSGEKAQASLEAAAASPEARPDAVAAETPPLAPGQDEGFMGQRTILEEDVDVDETRNGLEVDLADAEALRTALELDEDPRTGKPLQTDQQRQAYRAELEQLETTIGEAQQFLQSRPAAATTDAPAPAPAAAAPPAVATAATVPASAGPEREAVLARIRAAETVTPADVAALGARPAVGVAAAAQLYSQVAGVEVSRAMPIVRAMPDIGGKPNRDSIAVLQAAQQAVRARAPGAGTALEPVAPRPPLVARLGNREVEVESFEDASRKFLALAETTDTGGMPVVELVDAAGKIVGTIGNQGEVYAGSRQERVAENDERRQQGLPDQFPDPVYSPPTMRRATPAYRQAMAEFMRGEREVPPDAADYTAIDGEASPGPAAALEPPVERRAAQDERARIDALPADERDAEIVRLRSRVEELEQGARTNQVTGLANKAAFEADAALGWPTVAAIDMDGLKRLNDTVGHEAADAVLRALARELEAIAGDDVRVYHRSGDEFAVRFKDAKAAASTMASLQEELEATRIHLVDQVEGEGDREYVYQGIGISYGVGKTYEAADLAANQQKRDRLDAGLREDARVDGAPGRLRPVPRDPAGSDGVRQGQPSAEEVDGGADPTDLPGPGPAAVAGAATAANDAGPGNAGPGKAGPPTAGPTDPAGPGAAPADPPLTPPKGGVLAPVVSIDAAAAEAATSPQNDLPAPSEGQIEAGNYRKGHLTFNGLGISIENPAGTHRRPEWPPLVHHYGYIKRTEGADGEHVDTFLSDQAKDPTLPVFIVNQVNRDGSFDEHKVMLGFANEEAARKGYAANYTKDFTVGPIATMSLREFKAWLKDGDTTKPAPVARPMPKVRIVAGMPQFKLEEGTLGAYFQPGRIVNGYGGRDRVIDFQWNGGSWSVNVIAVDKDGAALPNERVRTHSTLPDRRELAKVLGQPSQFKTGRKPAAPPAKVAAPAPAAPAPAAAKPAATPAPAPATITDVGQKIGGARKDQWRDRGLQVGDLAGMTGGEAAEYSTKANVWRPDYAAMVEAGTDPIAAGMVKQLWDRVAASPHSDSATARQHYIEAVNLVRELLQNVKTVQDVDAVGAKFRERTGRNALPRHVGGFQEFVRQVPLYAAIARKRGYTYRFWENSYKDQRAAAQLVATGWPAKKAAGDGPKRERAAEPERPHLDNIPRTGPDYRKGKDVSAEDFRQAFGFRGVEFGNWAAQDERQKLINLAYDGLQDMARVLGLPPAALSLNGTLGLGLGARGKGAAAAHYEPGKVVINMTKLSGAGALAHEWGHAMDHYFGELDQANAYGGHGRYASGGRGRPTAHADDRALQQLRPEMQKAWHDVLNAIYRKARGKADQVRELELASERLQEAVAKLEAIKSPAPFEQQRLEAMQRRLAALQRETDFARGQPDDAEWDAGTSEILEAIKAQGLGPYWSRPTELLARSFEAYVNGKIQAEGLQSQYLASIPKNAVWPQPGGSLERVTKAMDKFFAAVKTEPTPKGIRLFSVAGRAGSDRASWSDFPPVAIADPFGPGQKRLSTHPDYAAGKAGDAEAALRLAQDYVTPDVVAKVKALIGDRTPVLVPVLATEATGNNWIPNAYAQVLAKELGLTVSDDVVQAVRAHHTGAGAFHRLAFQAAFEGPVVAGQDYLILDDAITLGGTLANLRGHLEANGGKVIGATVLTGHPNGATMALSPATLQRLRETYGNDLESYLQDEFGFGVEHLSEGEAGHILAARTLDAVRDRVAQARREALQRRDAKSLGEAEVTGPGLTLERGQALKQQLTAKWGENAPSIILVESAEELPAGAKVDVDPKTGRPLYLRAEGFYDGRPTVWLNLGRIPTERRFAEVLAHEALGHFGVEQVVGAKEWPAIASAIARLEKSQGVSPKIRAVLENVRERYGAVDEDTFAREVIAVMAERGIRNSLVGRVVAAVRSFLRRVMPSTSWSEAELLQLLASADRFLRSGQTYAARAAERQAMAFSVAPAADVLEDLEAGLVPLPLVARIRQAIADATPAKLKDNLRSVWVGALALNHLTELASDYFGGMAGHYSSLLAEMSADRNILMDEGADLASRARKWASKDRAMAKDLFDLMHAATIDGVDPSKEFQPLQFRYSGQLLEVTRSNVAAAKKAIREQMRGRSGEPKQNFLNEIKKLDAMLASAGRRKRDYGPMVARWNALSPEAQQYFREMRDLYEARSDAVEAALVQRIEDLKADGVSDQQRRVMITKLRDQFETNRLQGVYFPLQRFGQHYLAAEKAGTSTYLMFESKNAMEREKNRLAGLGWTITVSGKKGDQLRAADAPSGSFVADVISTLRDAKISDKTQDDIYQLYLSALPELSLRKHAIHRKSVPGYHPDALRAFGWHMQHGAHQLARLRFMHKLQAVLEQLKKQNEAWKKEHAADVRGTTARDEILNELERRHEWVANPTDNPLTNLASSVGFAFYLGLTPAAALVNLTQTAIVSYPELAAQFGAVKAMNVLLAGMRDSIRTGGNIDRILTDPDEQRAYAAWKASGTIEKTQAHNLAGIAEHGMQGYNPAWERAMEIIGWGFHKAEVVNREATAIAAFRLARADGMAFDQAVKFGHDTVVRTHFDYSNANRARFMQSGPAKVLLMFKQYSLNMSWFLGRNLWQATANESPEVRAIARRKLVGVLGMTSLFAGTLGLPLVSTMFGVINAVAASFGDDDEPFDAETEFRNFLADHLGTDMARVLATGPMNELTGADLAGRVSLSQLWFRDADRELEGSGAYYHLLEQIAGPLGGMVKNILVGKQRIDEGHVMRGVETMLPKALKDGLKALRYSTEGVNSLRGDALVEDLSLWQTLLQLQGFTPAEVAQQYDTNRAFEGYEGQLEGRKQRLMNAYALAARLGDAEGKAATMEKIKAYNLKVPEDRITGRTINASLRQRRNYSERAVNGIVLNRRLARRLQEQVRFAGEGDAG